MSWWMAGGVSTRIGVVVHELLGPLSDLTFHRLAGYWRWRTLLPQDARAVACAVAGEDGDR